jgi:hypothetical protein
MTNDDHEREDLNPPFSSPCAEGEVELVRGVHFLDGDSIVDEVMAETRAGEAESPPAVRERPRDS